MSIGSFGILGALLAGMLYALLPAFGEEGQQRQDNRVLLGVVSAPAERGLEVLEVLAGSPADSAGLKVGDVLTQLAGQTLTKPSELDLAMRPRRPGVELALAFARAGQRQTVQVAPMPRREYPGKRLRAPAQGSIGFEAVPWLAYAWSGVEPNQAPTLENTRGKVVVIHAFQGW